VIAVYVLLGIALNFTPLDPIKALYWSAVVNGVLAPPVMVLLMLLVSKEKVMGKLTIEGWLYWLGWIATAVMALSLIGMAADRRRRLSDAIPVEGVFLQHQLKPPRAACSDSAGQCKDDNDDEEHADDSAGTVSPAAAVAPGGKGADQHQNEYH
jgi:hypothetical protein